MRRSMIKGRCIQAFKKKVYSTQSQAKTFLDEIHACCNTTTNAEIQRRIRQIANDVRG